MRCAFYQCQYWRFESIVRKNVYYKHAPLQWQAVSVTQSLYLTHKWRFSESDMKSSYNNTIRSYFKFHPIVPNTYGLKRQYRTYTSISYVEKKDYILVRSLTFSLTVRSLFHMSPVLAWLELITPRILKHQYQDKSITTIILEGVQYRPIIFNDRREFQIITSANSTRYARMRSHSDWMLLSRLHRDDVNSRRMKWFTTL